MGFKIKKLGAIKQYRQWKDIINWRFLAKVGIVLGSIALILFLAKLAFGYIQEGFSFVGKNTTKFVAQELGEPMETDELGHINALIVGYSGIQDWGGLLTDTIMVASFNPTLGTTTFLSIPRDLFVKYKTGARGRINGVYRNSYLEYEGDEDLAIQDLRAIVEDITGLTVPYYMMVDFEGFVAFVDEMGGVTIDVKEPIHDPYYPGPNNSYETFHMDGGEQQMDGETALKYARSRKTTSDFSRALRQQQIIKAIISQVLKNVGLANITALKDIYARFDAMTVTNVSLKQMLGLLPHVNDLPRFFSFVYSADCDLRYLDLTDPGCVLRYGIREEFGGAAAIIPQGASYGNIDYYKHTQDFAFWVTHHQEFLMENAEVGVFNGIDKDTARAAGYNVNGVASQLALDMKVRGLNIVDIDNTETFFEKTILYLPGRGWYPATVDILKSFVDIAEIRVDENNQYSSGGVTLVLGQDYLKRL